MKSTLTARASAWHAAAVLVAVALPAVAQTSPDVIVDTTTYSYAQRASGAPAILPVTRTFERPIKSLSLIITAGQADDIGFVGNTLVTDVAPACRRVSAVVAPVDVSDQVTISGNTASFTLIAVENCCCFTGWGPATEGGRTPATFEWHVVLEPSCGENVCLARCAPEPPDLSAKGSFNWTTGDTEADCPVMPGKFGGNVTLSGDAKVDNATCAGDCKSELSLAGKVDAKIDICRRPIQIAQTFEYARKTDYEKVCDTDTCHAKCDPTRYCLDQEGSYEIEVGATNHYGLDFDVGSSATANMALTSKCGIDLGVSGAVKGTVNTSENHGSAGAGCKDCQSLSGDLTVKGSAKGGCTLTLHAPGWHKDLGCDDCASLDLTTGVNGKHSSCGETCGGAKVSLNGALNTPEVCLNAFGMVAKLKATATVKASTSTDSCAGFSSEGPSFAGQAVAEIGPNTRCGN